MVITILFITLVVTIAYFYYCKIYLTEKKSQITGLTFIASLQYLFFYGFGNVQYLVEYMQKHQLKDLFAFWLGPIYLVQAIDADSAKFVLKDPRFRKVGVPLPSDTAQKTFGENLVGVNGEVWRKQRSLVNFGFHSEALTSYYPVFCELVEKAMNIVPLDTDLEVCEFFSRFTLDLLGKTIFNHDFQRLDRKNDIYYQAYYSIINMINSPLFGLFMAFPSFCEKLPFKSIQDNLKSVRILAKFFEEMIEQHKGKPDNSILSHMLRGADESGITHQELISNIWIFFLAGHETTSTALSWALNCLRAHPEIQEKLYLEIEEKIGHKNIPTEEELTRLTYMDCFIQEVMRLHTPLPSLVTREASEDIPYKDKLIPKGTRVGLFFHMAHINPEYWPEPDVFRPERFTPENKKGRNQFTYMPFSMGSRQCIGNNFSLLEQRLFLVRLLQLYRVVDPVNSKAHPVDKMFIVIAHNYCPLRLVKRN